MTREPEAPPTRAQAAFRRMLIILLIALGVVIYAYGWQVTDISLEPTQEQTRQESVTRALRELLSPNIFSQPTERETINAGFVIDCSTGEGAPAEADGAYVRMTPACGVGRDRVLVEGFGFAPGTDTELTWVPPTGQPRPVGTALTDSLGNFSLEITVPNIRSALPGTQVTLATTAIIPVGSPRLSETTHLVIDKMIETIFLALIATTLSVPISIVVSFLAAHNLMTPIRMPVGKALVGLALFPVGWVAGQALLGPLAQGAVAAGQGDFSAFGGPAILLIASAATMQAGRKSRPAGGHPTPLQRLTSLAVTIIGLLALGLIGGLAITAGSALMASSAGLAAYLGNFIHTLGRLVELTILPLAGLAIAVFFAGLGMSLYTAYVTRLSPLVSHAAGVVLGAIGGAIVLVAAAAIGIQAALMTLLIPIIVGFLAAQVPVMLYDRTAGTTNRLQRTDAQNTLRRGLWALGFVAGFVISFVLFDVSRSVVQGRLPVAATTYPLAALVGAILGGITAGLTGVHANMPVGTIAYNTTRTTLNALRSIEPLIMGIVFVIWVGIGPFAGVLALTLHSVASLGKLFSEQIESIDEGPIEALLATGANRVQTIIYAVVPQIVPPYIAFTLYRWDINVRMSTIIGFVGGGGIGFLLQQQINLLRYREAGVAVLAIAIVVSILDYASASIRQRVT